MSGFSSIWDSISNTADDMHKNFSANAQQIESANQAYNQLRLQEQGMKLKQDEFDLMKMLSMQDHREKERKRKWKQDFARALSFGN
jgi:hypothetical protein